MNGNYGYQTNGYGQTPEPDYYTAYTNEKVKEAGKVFARYFLALFIYSAAALAVGFIIQFALIFIFGQEKAADLLNNNVYISWLLGVGPMYFVGFPIFYLIIRNMKTSKIEKKNISFGDFILLFLVAEGAMYAGSIVGNVLNSVISTILGHDVTNSTAELIEKSPFWLIILVVVAIGPIIEELMFRKFMIDRFSRYGDVLAVVLSSIAFGLFHGNFYQFFYAAMLGAILGYVYTTTRNIKYSIFMHMIINFFGSVVPMLLQDRYDEFLEMTEDFAAGAELNMSRFLENLMIVSSYSVVQYGLMISGIVIFVNALTRHKIKFNGACEYKIPKEKVSATVILNPGVILFLIFAMFQFAVNIFLA